MFVFYYLYIHSSIFSKGQDTNMVTLNIAPEYGYVVMVGTTMVFVNVWKIMRIGGIRKKLGIKYHIMYSEKDPNFNSYQRAHQKTLEFVPYFYPPSLTSGIRHLIGAAAAGGVFVLGWIIYALGYNSGDPQKLVPGALISEVLGLLSLQEMSVSFGAGLLGWW